MSVFDQAFSIIIGNEGGFSNNPADPGNWTGGRPGSGMLRGTKYGISAGSHPDLDIAGLTLDQARSLYRREYWDRVNADALPPPLALLLFDTAVNCGTDRAARWLQQSVKTQPDGLIGPSTLQAVQNATRQPAEGAAVCAEFLALRLAFMAGLPTWRTFGLGWARRLCRLPYGSMTITG